MEIKKKQSLIFIGVILISVHFLFYLVFSSLKLNNSFIWNLTDFFLLLAITILMVLSLPTQKERTFTAVSKFGEIFLNNTKTISSLILIYLGFGVTFAIIDYFLSSRFLKLLENEIDLIFSISLTYFALTFKLSWLNHIKRKKIDKYQKILATSISLFAIFFVLSFFLTEDRNLPEDFTLIFALFFSFLFLLAFNVKTWLPLSPRTTQKSLLWYSLLMLVATIALFLRINEHSNNFLLSSSFFATLTKVFALSLFITYARTFYYAIISLPFSKVIEQKVYEMNTLSYLGKIVRNFGNLERVYEAIVELSSNAMGASPSWLQTYTQSNGTNFISIKGTSLEKLKLLYENNGLLIEIKTTEHPIVYPNISDNFQLNRPVFESLCVVPIKFSDKLLGHLIVGNENPYFFDGDDLSLLSTYVDTLCIALEGNQLLNETIKNEQYKKELQIAKEIQYNLLPKDFPNHPKLEIELFFKPSEEVGGDFYDFIELGRDRLLILIGDVSGKGISASYYMMLLKGIILSSNATDKSIIDLILHINQSLINKIDKQIHITMAGLLFDFKNNTAEYIRAGHLPLLISSDGNIEIYKPSGIGLSVVKTDFLLKHLTTEHISLSDGTYLLMLTDGLVEALGNKNINVGIEKLKQILKESVFRNANELKELILGNVYESGTIFDDDITLMVIRYL